MRARVLTWLLSIPSPWRQDDEPIVPQPTTPPGSNYGTRINSWASQTAIPYPWRQDDDIVSAAVQAIFDEDSFWLTRVLPSTQTFNRLYLPDPTDEIVPQAVTFPGDESDLWQPLSVSSPLGRPQVTIADDDYIPQVVTEEDWKIILLFLTQTRGLYFFADDDLPIAPAAIVDEEGGFLPGIGLRAQQVQPFTADDDLPITPVVTIVDEDGWKVIWIPAQAQIVQPIAVDEDYPPQVVTEEDWILRQLNLTPWVSRPVTTDEDFAPPIILTEDDLWLNLGFQPVVYRPPLTALLDDPDYPQPGTGAVDDDLFILKVAGPVYVTLGGKMKVRIK